MSDNLSAGIADPYWYEWSVGLLYVLEMLIDDNIKHVTLQADQLQGLDDVVVTYMNDVVVCIQIKHTRAKDTLTFTDLIYKTAKKTSLLSSFCKDWKIAQSSNYKECRAILFSNRSIGVRKSTISKENMTPYERPALETFWDWMSKELLKVESLSQIEVPDKWSESWKLWVDELNYLDDKEKVLFLRSFEIKSNQADLDEIVNEIANKLSRIFKIDKRIAFQLDQKLCYALRSWTTSSRHKEEITREDVFTALALGSDKIKGEHNLKVAEPFFSSRLNFVNELERFLIKRTSPVIFLSGDPGSGKTNIVSHISNKNDSVVTLRFHAFKPITSADLHISADKGISDPRDLWGNFLIELRELLKGKLSKYNVPISNELLDTNDKLIEEVLRLSELLAAETNRTTVIVIDGIDHAARAGEKNSFLSTLVPPERVPEKVCFLIAGQPIHQYDLYPDWLADTDRVMHLTVPEIVESDIKQLYNQQKMNISNDNADIAVKLINETAAGNTLSAIFAICEALSCNDITELEHRLGESKLSSGVNSYYEYIWKSAKENIPDRFFFLDTILAGTLSLVNKRITPKIMTDICDDNTIGETAWNRILKKLYPIVVKDGDQYRVFHNDVRIYLERYLRKDKDDYAEVSGKLADYYLYKSDDIKQKHEIIFKLLNYANRKNEYIDVFTESYIIEAVKLKRSMDEIINQMEATIQSLSLLNDFEKLIDLSCSISTIYQYKQSLQWLDIIHESEVELPLVLESEKRVINKSLFTIESLQNMFNDVWNLISFKEYLRAESIINRWFEGVYPEDLAKILLLNNQEVNISDEELHDDVGGILETWGEVSRHLDFTFDNLPEVNNENDGKYRAYFSKGWLAESCHFISEDGIIRSLRYHDLPFFIIDIENYFNTILLNDNVLGINLIVKNDFIDKFSKISKIKFVDWCIVNQKTELCSKWLDEILSLRFKYIEDITYTHSKDLFPGYSRIAFILGYYNKDPKIIIEECLVELKRKKILSSERDIYAAYDLINLSVIFGIMCSALLSKHFDRIDNDDFQDFIDRIYDRNSSISHYDLGCIELEGIWLSRIIRLVNSTNETLQALLLESIIANVKVFENIKHLDVSWNFLKKAKQDDLLMGLFDYWMNEQGILWERELSDINDIAYKFISKAKDYGWKERVEKSQEILDNKKVGYVGRKDYSLFAPLKLYRQLVAKDSIYWNSYGCQMLNISKFASDTGDNRAAVFIESGVAESAGEQGIHALIEFSLMNSQWDENWIQSIFDGMIAALKEEELLESELLTIWETASESFYVNKNSNRYDGLNEIRKAYISDIKEVIIITAKRLGINHIEEKMKMISSNAFSYNRNMESVKSFSIPERWFDNEKMSKEVEDFYNNWTESTFEVKFDRIKALYYSDEHRFRWSIVLEFLKRIEKSKVSIYVDDIVTLLTQKRDYFSWQDEGAIEVIDKIIPTLDNVQIKKLVTHMSSKYFEESYYGKDSKLLSFYSDLEYFVISYYRILSAEKNVEALKKLLGMHMNWITGYSNISLKEHFEMVDKERLGSVNSWEELCSWIRNNGKIS